ncbi:hypothetical protein [Tropicibacter alexandrii]|uniref:hypothetical protein n=1 Tax=Tropicibacter alexandrii TaxID=2267683 RepID=UPI000EF472E6|nr:hypothetical protein [Tropicibacter alexandrii]
MALAFSGFPQPSGLVFLGMDFVAGAEVTVLIWLCSAVLALLLVADAVPFFLRRRVPATQTARLSEAVFIAQMFAFVCALRLVEGAVAAGLMGAIFSLAYGIGWWARRRRDGTTPTVVRSIYFGPEGMVWPSQDFGDRGADTRLGWTEVRYFDLQRGMLDGIVGFVEFGTDAQRNSRTLPFGMLDGKAQRRALAVIKAYWPDAETPPNQQIAARAGDS